MTQASDPRPRSSAARGQLRFERVYRASLRDVWELWTTKAGIESWWGPGGFAVTVRKLDLRPGGELLYDMTAVDPPQIEFMRKAGMPLSTPARITFREVVPRSRLAYIHVVDFVPDVAPYEVAHVIELQAMEEGRVRMVVAIDAMHDEEWSQRAAAGWDSELGRLDALLNA